MVGSSCRGICMTGMKAMDAGLLHSPCSDMSHTGLHPGPKPGIAAHVHFASLLQPCESIGWRIAEFCIAAEHTLVYICSRGLYECSDLVTLAQAAVRSHYRPVCVQTPQSKPNPGMQSLMPLTPQGTRCACAQQGTPEQTMLPKAGTIY